MYYIYCSFTDTKKVNTPSTHQTAVEENYWHQNDWKYNLLLKDVYRIFLRWGPFAIQNKSKLYSLTVNQNLKSICSFCKSKQRET